MTKLKKTCRELAKEVDDTLKASVENIKDYQELLEDAQKEISRLTSIIETEQIIGKAEWRKGKELEAKIESANKKLAEFTQSDIPSNRGNYLDELAENIHDEICKMHLRNGQSWAKLVQPIIWKWWEKYGENILEIPRKENQGVE